MTASKAMYASLVLTISNAEQRELQKFSTTKTSTVNQFGVTESEYNELRNFSNELSSKYHLDYIAPVGTESKPNPVFLNLDKAYSQANFEKLPTMGKYIKEFASLGESEVTVELQGLNDNYNEFLVECTINHGDPKPEKVDMMRALEEGDRNNLMTSGTALNMFFGYAKMFFPSTDVYQTEVILIVSETEPAIIINVTHVGVKADV